MANRFDNLINSAAPPSSNSNSTTASLLTPENLPKAKPPTPVVTRNRFDNSISPAEDPYAIAENKYNASTLGIIGNTISEIPHATFTVVKDIVQGIARSAGSAVLTVPYVAQFLNPSSQNNPLINTDKQEAFQEWNLPKFLQPIFGTDKIKNLGLEVADAYTAVKNNPFAQKIGASQPKYAFPLAFGTVIGSTTLDLSTFSAEGDLAKALIKETNPENILKLLVKRGIDTEIAQKAAPELAKIVDKTEMGAALDIIKAAEGLKKGQALTAEAGQTLVKTFETAAPNNVLERIPQESGSFSKGELNNILDESRQFSDSQMEMNYKAFVQRYSKFKRNVPEDYQQFVDKVPEAKNWFYSQDEGEPQVFDAFVNRYQNAKKGISGSFNESDFNMAAQNDWEQNYAERYQGLADRAEELAKQLKNSGKKNAPNYLEQRDQAMIQGEINHLNQQQIEIENEFVNKWRQNAGLPPEAVDRKPGTITADEFVAKQQAELGGPLPEDRPAFAASENIPYNQETLANQSRQRIEEYTRTPAQVLGNLPNDELASFKPIVQQTIKTVKDKVHALDYFATPEFVLKKLGLEKSSEMLHAANDAYKVQVRQELQKVINWQKEVDGIPDAAKNIFKFLDGQDVNLVGSELKVANEIKTYLAEWANKLNLPEDKRIASYITHIFEKDFIQKEFDPDIAKIITDKVAGSVYDPFLQERLGKSGFIEDAFAALDAYVKRATRKVNMDPALESLKEQAKSLDIESYNYVMRLSHRINLRPTEVDNLVDNFIKSTIGYKFGQRPVTQITQGLRSMIYRGTLGLNFGAALRNLTQGVNTYAALGEKNTVLGYVKLFERMMTNNMDELVKNGVLEDELVTDRKLGVYKTILQKLDGVLFKFFETAEKINRGAAYFGAKTKYLNEGLSEEEAIKAAKTIVRKTQFAFGNIDSPVFMSSDLAKTVLQLQTFNLKQIEFLKNMIVNKEFAGLTRWTVASFATIYTIGRLFGMSPSDLIPTVRLGGSPLGNALGTLAGLVSTNQQTRDQSKARIGTMLSTMIPAGSQIRKTILGITAFNQGKDTTPTGRLRFKIDKTPGNFIRSAIFGKSALPQAQEYYSNIGKSKAPSGENRFNTTNRATKSTTKKSGNRFNQ